ncbi:MAG: ligase-associated DNA damage response exonuclease [Chlamydiales bacterium]|nr:ligase-associated DNA damage response exonuclease [Chlamydiales bacterium]
MSPLEVRPEGLYCSAGDFYVDAWAPVPTCVVTHAHSDHARLGHEHYIMHKDSQKIIEYRLGSVPLQTLTYGEVIKVGDCWVSLHPAGHVLGSAQVRIETKHGVYVVSGDYKRALDATCPPFEPLECDVFITESTFALPIYRWDDPEVIAGDMFDWWEQNRAENRPSIILCYALGKAQRILSMLKPFTDRSVYVHGAILPICDIYAQHGVEMLDFLPIEDKTQKFGGELILAPPSALGSPWMKRFPLARVASASGWMQVRGMRRRKGIDKGFVLSDHADWDELLQTIEQTKAKQVYTAHGYSAILAKYLSEERSIKAVELHGLESSEEGEE